MILGIGSDIVDITRMERLLKRVETRFIHKILTPFERAQYEKTAHGGAFCAKRFAAKEAALKALGTGFAQGISWQDMQVSNHASGKPILTFSGQALAHLNTLTPLNHTPAIHLSLSDTSTLAQAFVVIDCYGKML